MRMLLFSHELCESAGERSFFIEILECPYTNDSSQAGATLRVTAPEPGCCLCATHSTYYLL